MSLRQELRNAACGPAAPASVNEVLLEHTHAHESTYISFLSFLPPSFPPFESERGQRAEGEEKENRKQAPHTTWRPTNALGRPGVRSTDLPRLLSRFASRARQLEQRPRAAQKDESVHYLALTESLPTPDLKTGGQGTN